jgi:hypothetical protein
MQQIYLLFFLMFFTPLLLNAQIDSVYASEKAQAINIISYQKLCQQEFHYKLLLGKKDKLIASYSYSQNNPNQLQKVKLKQHQFILDADRILFHYNIHTEKLTQLSNIDDIGCLKEGLILVKKGNLHGFMNEEAQVIIPLEYKQLYPFENEVSIAQKNDLWGGIDKNGKTIIPFKYRRIQRSSPTQIIAYQPNGKRVFYNNQGKKVPQEMSSMTFTDYLYYANDELSKKRQPKPMPDQLKPEILKMREQIIAKGYYRYQLDGKYGALDSLGNVLIAANYDELRSLDMSPYYSMAHKELPGAIIIGSTKVLGKNRWSVHNAKGELITDEKFEWISFLSNETLKIGKRKLLDQRVYYGLMDTKGKIHVDFIYKEITPFRDNNVDAYLHQEYYAARLDTAPKLEIIINNKGKILNDGIYEDLQYYGQIHRAKQDGKYGMLSSDGSVLVPFEYQNIGYLSKSRTYTQAQNIKGKWGCINNKGEVLIPFEYSEISPYPTRNHILARKNISLGVLDSLGNEVLPFKFKTLEYFGPHHYKTRDLNDKYGILDYETGDYIFPMIYDYIKRESGPEGRSVFLLKKDDRFGIYSEKHEEIIPIEYRFIKPMRYSQGKFFEVDLMKDDHYIRGVFDLEEKKLLHPCKYRQFMEFRDYRTGKHYYRLVETVGEEYHIHFMDALTGEIYDMETQPDGNFGLIQVSRGNGREKQKAWKQYHAEVISEYYSELFNFTDGYSLCKRGAKVGMLDKTGKEVIPLTAAYRYIKAPTSSKQEALGGIYFAVLVGEKWGIIDLNQNFVIETIYNSSEEAFRAAMQKINN